MKILFHYQQSFLSSPMAALMIKIRLNDSAFNCVNHHVRYHRDSFLFILLSDTVSRYLFPQFAAEDTKT